MHRNHPRAVAALVGARAGGRGPRGGAAGGAPSPFFPAPGSAGRVFNLFSPPGGKEPAPSLGGNVCRAESVARLLKDPPPVTLSVLGGGGPPPPPAAAPFISPRPKISFSFSSLRYHNVLLLEVFTAVGVVVSRAVTAAPRRPPSFFLPPPSARGGGVFLPLLLPPESTGCAPPVTGKMEVAWIRRP